MQGYIGELKLFGGTFAPENWAFCEGQTMPINQYTALFSIIGTQFGGDGYNNFHLPDLRCRVPVGSGTGPGLTPRVQGHWGGTERVVLTKNQLPIHNHYVKCDMITAGRSIKNDPTNRLNARSSAAGYGDDDTGNTTMNDLSVENSGGSQSHENMPPFNSLRYIICLIGDYPPRT